MFSAPCIFCFNKKSDTSLFSYLWCDSETLESRLSVMVAKKCHVSLRASALSTSWTHSAFGSSEHASCSASDHESKQRFGTPPTVPGGSDTGGSGRACTYTHTPIASRQREPSTDQPHTKTSLGAAVLLQHRRTVRHYTADV